jgi:hypothetical protein
MLHLLRCLTLFLTPSYRVNVCLLVVWRSAQYLRDWVLAGILHFGCSILLVFPYFFECFLVRFLMYLNIHLNNSKTSVDYATSNTKLPVQAMCSRMEKSKTQLNQQKESCEKRRNQTVIHSWCVVKSVYFEKNCCNSPQLWVISRKAKKIGSNFYPRPSWYIMWF